MSVILIRVDGSAEIGTGHIFRCLALAQALRSGGGQCIFALAISSPILGQRLNEEGFQTLALDVTVGAIDDAKDTVQLARNHHAKWIVADGYKFGHAWQRLVRSMGCRLLVLDDYGHSEQYESDIILNQNASATENLYIRRANDSRLLLGSRFVLLRREFLEKNEWKRLCPERACKVLVTLGGADPDNVTLKVIRALLELADLEVIVVVGPANPHQTALSGILKGHEARIRLVSSPSDMSALIIWADVAIAASGSTTWELAYLGLPSLVIVLADNQRSIGAYLEQQGIACCLGDHAELTIEMIRSSLTGLLENSARRLQMSEAGRKIIDGHGAARVAASLLGRIRITLVSDADSWVNESLHVLKGELEADGHRVRLIHDPEDIWPGDLAFFLSLGRVVPSRLMRRSSHNLVVHASPLPQGRGWSPMTWQILEGKNDIPICLLEAGAAVDSGAVYIRDVMRFKGNELLPELRCAVATATSTLCRQFVRDYPFGATRGVAQVGEPSYYRRRGPEDSRLDPEKSIKDQFNLLRTCDPERYPAFFEHAGRRFEIRIQAVN